MMTVHDLILAVNDVTHVYLYQNGRMLAKKNERCSISSFYNDWRVDCMWTYRKRIEASISPPHLWRKEQDNETSRSNFTH